MTLAAIWLDPLFDTFICHQFVVARVYNLIKRYLGLQALSDLLGGFTEQSR